MDNINEIRKAAGLAPLMEQSPQVQQIKDTIESWFDSDEGREDLHHLAEYIETNLNEIQYAGSKPPSFS